MEFPRLVSRQDSSDPLIPPWASAALLRCLFGDNISYRENPFRKKLSKAFQETCQDRDTQPPPRQEAEDGVFRSSQTLHKLPRGLAPGTYYGLPRSRGILQIIRINDPNNKKFLSLIFHVFS